MYGKKGTGVFSTMSRGMNSTSTKEEIDLFRLADRLSL
jgi:hypothetical protein